MMTQLWGKAGKRIVCDADGKIRHAILHCILERNLTGKLEPKPEPLTDFNARMQYKKDDHDSAFVD